MTRIAFPVALLVALVALLPGCEKRDSASAPSTASATSVNAADPDEIGKPKYALCAPQTGADAKQLAPAFLDKMASCNAVEIAPVDSLATIGGEGKLNPKSGNCDYQSGLSCHFHTSMEFVSSTKLKDDENAVGEMHCIVRGPNKNSPTVYGGHLKCKAGTSSEKGSKSCATDLLHAMDGKHCQKGWKCCDKGTLTKAVSKQGEAEKKLRPDFRICEDDFIEIDCGLLHGMHGHPANVAGLGQEIHGKFSPTGHDDHHEELE